MSTGETIITYGNVTLFRVTTREFRQEPLLEPSNTDLRCWKFTVRVSGYLHGRAAAGNAASWQEFIDPVAVQDRNGNPVFGNAGLTHTAVRFNLPPRQSFQMIVGAVWNGVATQIPNSYSGGTVVLYGNPLTAVSTPADLSTTGLTDFDVHNGPVCTEFVAHQFATNEVWRVDATFVICKVECDANGEALSNTSGVLSHRWSSQDAIDANWMTTQRYSGLLTIATAQFSPHWFRYLVVPPLQGGFRRESLNFVASDDGLQLQYTVVDKEIAQAAPWPATKWQVNHTEGAQKGMIGFGAVDVTLYGDGMTDKKPLITLALYIIDAVLFNLANPGLNAVPANTVFLDELAITDHIGDEQVITAYARVRKVPVTLQNFQADVSNIGTPLTQAQLPALPAGYSSYDPKLSRGARDQDTNAYQGPISLIGIFRSILQSPCTGASGIGTILNRIDQNGETSQSPFVSASVIDSSSFPTTTPAYYSSDKTTAAYTAYQVESIYHNRQMIAAMPIALSDYLGTTDSRDTMAAVSLGAPQVRRTLRIVAERIGQQPRLPDPATLEGLSIYVGGGSSIAMTYLHSKLLAGTREYNAAGQVVYRDRLEATYALSRPPANTVALPIGNNLWTNVGLESTNTNVTNGA